MGFFFSHSLFFEAVQRPRHHLLLHLLDSDLAIVPLLWMANWCFFPTLCQETVSCRCFSVSLPMPLCCWMLCFREPLKQFFYPLSFREPLKQFFYPLSRQQSLLTSLCSHSCTCCQLLSAHNQPKWIMLQWASNLHKAKWVPRPDIHKGPTFLRKPHSYSCITKITEKVSIESSKWSGICFGDIKITKSLLQSHFLSQPADTCDCSLSLAFIQEAPIGMPRNQRKILEARIPTRSGWFQFW